MSKQTKLLKIKDDRLRFQMKSVKVKLYLKPRDSQYFIRQHAVIVLINDTNNRQVVHPITQFLFENWKYREYNTQKIHANNLIQFLNWLLINQRQLRVSSLSDIQFKHATAFLNLLTREGKSRTTVMSIQRTLTQFYYYLSKKGLLAKITDQLFQKKSIPQLPNKKYVASPFKGVILPSNGDSNIAHMIPEKYILPFIETVVRVANPIALGVYIQFFGGLRQGELVNLRRTDVTSIGAFGEDGLILKLRKNVLRPDLIDSSGAAGVKKERTQLVFPVNDWLQILYKNHLNTYKATDGSDALFVNRDGRAMSGRGYRYYFEKAKEAFLGLLKHSDDPKDKIAALKLRGYKWSTHIGRGIFTNLLAEEAQNPYDIALPRGDSSLSSSIVYQGNTLRMKENLEARMNDLYKDYLPKLLGVRNQ
ncbi:tyrosine-type recombinase/integrase [Gordoniibacillus kamchatkensis]|uniref:tyrosine-type recombinase/integrase n=1 Tax=Gordoniibacillus kamchatkensis TaxID=1590651 RepID=UPI000B260EB0|nr:hypothetical protein [Paenibacillus sp. VKM B-2647]